MNSPFELDELDGAELSERMDRSLSGLHLDPEALAARAIGAGRPLRRRRQVIAVVASVAAFGLVGGAGAYAITGLSTTRDQIVQPAKTANPSPSQPTKTADPSPSQAALTRRLPARVVALRLERRLGFDLAQAVGQESPDGLYVGAVSADSPKVGIRLNIQGDFHEVMTCDVVGVADCTETRTKSGGRVMRYTYTRAGYRTANADRLEPDGTRIALAVAYPLDEAYRITASKVARVAAGLGGDGLREAPSEADLAAAEREMVPWELLDDSATEEPEPSDKPDGNPGVLTARLAALYLSRLAPAESVEFFGFQQADLVTAIAMIDRADPQASGKAALRVDVKVDPKSELPGCDDPALSSCKLSRPDEGVGMRQAVTDLVNMGEETKVITVDVLRADGTLVTVTGGNTARFRAGHPRPGTDLDDVTAIALDEAWDVDAEPRAKDLAAAKKLDPFIWMKSPDDF